RGQGGTNRLSRVSSEWTRLRECSLGWMPKGVMNVRKRAFWVLVFWRKRDNLCSSSAAYDLSMVKGVLQNLISQRWMQSSFRSIMRSICAPFSDLFLGL